MMKTSLSSWVLLALFFILVLGGCTSPQPTSVLPATINRDCGPADGPAFTIAIPWDGGGQVVISIWQAPELGGRSRFSLTDPTDQTGSATLFTGADALEPLSGTVTFEGVNVNKPVDGAIRLVSASGALFEGQFRAEWGTAVAYCG